jgi:taurine dioxygenase
LGYRLSPLPGRPEFGAIVTGLTPDMLDDAAVRTSLYDQWIDKGLLVFREMDGLDTLIRLSAVFGEVEDHPLLRGTDVPLEHRLTTDVDEKALGIYQVDGERRGGWQGWHKDSMYMEQINHGGILWARVVPERGGETGFIDQIAAYEALPAGLKARTEGLSVLYKFSRDSVDSRFGPQPDRRICRDPRRAALPMHENARRRSIHPMVYAQPRTGRRVANVSPWFAEGIEGMETAAGDALLREVIAHITRPEHAYFHRWLPGEMVLWDNWRMLHCATGTPAGMRRRLTRTIIIGDYALGRREETGQDVAPDLDAIGQGQPPATA